MTGATIESTSLGGGIRGVSTKQTTTSFRSSEDASTRGILRRAWNTPYATGTFNNEKREIGPFRAVNNLGDFLGRVNFSSGGPNQTGVTNATPASSTNVKFVPDSSDYITYKKQAAMNRNYNDSSHGGDESNASFVPMGRARR